MKIPPGWWPPGPLPSPWPLPASAAVGTSTATVPAASTPASARRFRTLVLVKTGSPSRAGALCPGGPTLDGEGEPNLCASCTPGEERQRRSVRRTRMRGLKQLVPAGHRDVDPAGAASSRTSRTSSRENVLPGEVALTDSGAGRQAGGAHG